MKTLEDVRGRCRIDGKHWIWSGASWRGLTRVHAPDYTAGGKMKPQPGPRAVWHLKTGKPIPAGWRVYGCGVELCVSPECIVCESPAKRGKKIAKSGVWKGNPKRVIANRLTGRKLSDLSPELIAFIISSDKSGAQIERETGIKRRTISKVRTGQRTAYAPMGGLFTGLVAR